VSSKHTLGMEGVRSKVLRGTVGMAPSGDAVPFIPCGAQKSVTMDIVQWFIPPSVSAGSNSGSICPVPPAVSPGLVSV
jgi:hypothetical protein